jgi:hypothetical protein
LRRVAPHHPAHRPLLRQLEAHQHVGVQVVREGELARIGDRVIGAARLDVVDRIGGAWRGLDPIQGRRDGALELLEDALLRAAGAHRQPRRLQLQRLARPRAAAQVDDQLRDVGVGCGRHAGPAPVSRVAERGGGDIRAPGGELRLHGALVGDRVDGEAHAELLREALRQLELQAFGALRAEVVAGGEIQRHNPQLAGRPYLRRSRVRQPAAARESQRRDRGGECQCPHEPPLAPGACRQNTSP